MSNTNEPPEGYRQVGWLFGTDFFEQELLFPYEVDKEAFKEHPEYYRPIYVKDTNENI